MSNSKPPLKAPSVALANKIDSTVHVEQEVDTSLVENRDRQVHAFKVGNIGLILPETEVSELLDKIPSCRLPNTNRVLHGMANLRGRIIPLFDLQYVLNVPKTKTKFNLVIGTGEESVAVLLENMPQQITITEQDGLDNLPPIPESLKPFVSKAYSTDDGLWFDFDVFNFFSSLKSYIQ